MGLSPRGKRAYWEARYRREHGGAASPNWHGDEEDVVVWMNAMVLAEQDNVGPWDALLIAVKRRSARVRWCDSVAEHIMVRHRAELTPGHEDYDPERAGDPDVPPAEVRRWLAESRNEERLMTRAAKMAIDAGVADAMIRRVKFEGAKMADALVAGLDVLELTHEQRMKALGAMQDVISQFSAGPATGPGVIEGGTPDD